NGGNLELSGDVTISGKALTLDTTNAAYGAIYSGDGTNTWNGPITLSKTAVISVKTGSGVILGEAVSGVGGVTKIGPGILTYSGTSANSYSATTTVNEATLTLANSSATTPSLGPRNIGDARGGTDA